MKEPAHLGLARKYRPQLFEEIVGQEAVAVTLGNAVASSRPAPAYLFFGPKGIGKTTAARILAKALNCHKGPAPKPCGKCPSCAEIALSSSIDVLELDAASNTQVEKIREMIIETVGLAPSRDRYKIFIIDEAHMLSSSSFNALLKTLEEPPPHVVFILATTESAKIPATIVSRCQRFRFRAIERGLIESYLAKIARAEKIKAEKDALSLLARAAGGALRDAVSLLDQAAAFGSGSVDAAGVQELIGLLPAELLAEIGAAVLAKDALRLGKSLGTAFGEGFDPAELLRDLRNCLQEAYLFRLGVGGEPSEAWKSLAAAHPPETFSFLLKRVNRTLEETRKAESPQSAFELGLYGMLESAYDLRDWVKRLEALENRLAAGDARLSPAPGLAPATPAPAAQEPPRPKPAPETFRPSAPSAPSPAAGAGPALPPEGAWSAVVAHFAAERPALGGYLAQSRLLPAAGPEWRVVFALAFKRDQAEARREEIEREFCARLGRQIRLRFELGSAPAAKAGPEGGRDGGPAGHGAAPEGAKTAEGGPGENWVDASEGDAGDDPGIRKVLDVMGGRVKQVRRKK